MEIKNVNGGSVITDCPPVNLPLTLDCGQAFRWTRDGEYLRGVVKGHEAFIKQTGTELFFAGTDCETVREIFVPYLALDADYESITKRLSRDAAIAGAIEKYGVIRILRQDPWEALCSFIISQRRSIPSIRTAVEKLCSLFGDRAGGSWSFPDAKRLAVLPPGALDEVRVGYREPYIRDAAQRVAGGETDLDAISRMPLDEARAELMKIRGVGPKVADCTLLFGMNRLDAFPVDVHIGRFASARYPDGLPECFRGYEGVAQQYMFCIQTGL
ncbi:MAG: DNA-3-methyladenine glycosylase 2 family protein [Clostridia bacterium]|nr:DNA-3-methyladenine glycosylase 2 family protein [Clostridia bacterium]